MSADPAETVLAQLSDLVECEDGTVLDHAVILATGIAPDGAQGLWLERIGVEDVDATVRLIAAALFTYTHQDELDEEDA